jgi:hypothetical protein
MTAPVQAPMIHARDIQALTDLLRRTPMSHAEAIYAGDLIARLSQIAQPESEPAPTEEGRTEEVPLRPPPLAGY